MKPRHAAALALVVWCLGVRLGKEIPKKCPNCGFTLEIEAHSCEEKFETKAKCELGADKYVQDYYVKADKRDDLVVFPPTAECHEIEHPPN